MFIEKNQTPTTGHNCEYDKSLKSESGLLDHNFTSRVTNALL